MALDLGGGAGEAWLMSQLPEPPPSLLARIWRHPRRFGFLVFNLIALTLFLIWGVVTTRRDDSPLDLPEIAIGMTGTAVLVIIWVGAWIAWGLFVLFRQRRS